MLKKMTFPRNVPAIDVGIRNVHSSASRMQLARPRYAANGQKAIPVAGATRNAAYLGVGGGRDSLPVEKPRRTNYLMLALVGGVAWLAIRAR